MAIERRRPLPAGRYWIDVFPKSKNLWETWRDAMLKIDRVHIETTESYPGVDGAPEHEFIIFTLPVDNAAWPPDLGSPNTAPQTITTSADTATRPEPIPGLLDQATEAASKLTAGAKTTIGVVIGIAAVGLGVALFRK